MLNSRGSVHWPRVPQLGQAMSASGDRVGVDLLALLRLLVGEGLLQVVDAEALVAALALGERVGELADVARGDPGLARQDDRGVEADDVLASGHHRAPPLALDVLLELDPERPVVPGRAGAAVDLTAGEDEPPALAEGDDGVDDGGGGGHARQGYPGGNPSAEPVAPADSSPGPRGRWRTGARPTASRQRSSRASMTAANRMRVRSPRGVRVTSRTRRSVAPRELGEVAAARRAW